MSFQNKESFFKLNTLTFDPKSHITLIFSFCCRPVRALSWKTPERSRREKERHCRVSGQGRRVDREMRKGGGRGLPVRGSLP